MSIIIFGDSISEGANSTSRYSDYFSEVVKNYAVSGTTMGEYSIYPVDGKSLLRKYNCSDIKMADKILLEYGVNDISALMCGFVKMDTIVISFVKALDAIKQLNPEANVYFLSISDDYDIILKYANLQCSYLENVYFSKYDFKFPKKVWADNYVKLMELVGKSVKVIPMLEKQKVLSFNDLISNDNLHPNQVGHRVIFETVSYYLD